jgi:penicillin amidase
VIPAGILGYLAAVTYLSRPVLEGELVSAGIHGATSISRDENGSVLIAAAGQDDLMFGLGFVHAQERFFQMDLLRRSAAGELSELVGGGALRSDRNARRHGFRQVAMQAIRDLPEAQQALLRSYTAGVNDGLRKLSAAPFEYTLLMATPRPWQPEDSILVQASMYLMLQGGGERHPELMRNALEQVYDPQFVAFLLAPASEWDTPIDRPIDGSLDGEAPLGTPALPASIQLAASQLHGHVLSGQDPDVYERTSPGSNSWVVSNDKTREGYAILANDLHLPLRLPNPLFRVALQAEGSPLIVGVGMPGSPMLIVGSNGRIAWGASNVNGDWSDLVRIEKGSPQLTKVHERIAVKGGSPVDLEVEKSPVGPIIGSDAQYVYALKWVAQEVAGNNLNFMSMMTATTIEQAAAIASSSGIPHLNLLVVDQSGRALWTIAGRMPKRQGFSGERAVAWSDTVRWDGWLAAEEYPLLTNEQREALWTANNRVASGSAWEKIGLASQFALGVRARRVREALKAATAVTEADMHTLQLDDVSLLMQRWYELTLQAARSVKDPSAKAELEQVLAQWQGKAKADSAAYRIVRRFRGELAEEIMPQLLAKVLQAQPELHWDSVLPDWETPLWRVVSEQPVAALPGGSANWSEYLGKVLEREVYRPYQQQYGKLSRAVWGDTNSLTMQHPLSRGVPLLGRVLDMPTLAMNGDKDVVLGQFQAFGPAVRMVVAPGHEADGFLTMAGGQAGNPFAPYYGKGHEQWGRGVSMPLLPLQTRYSLRLVPKELGSQRRLKST